MNDFSAYANQQPAPESPLELFLRGMAGMVRQSENEKFQLKQHCDQLEKQNQQLPPSCIVAEGKQKELIAILNVLYEAGYATGCTKAEFMKRMADAMGAPGIANYTKALYNIKTTYKYDEIFQNLAEVAEREKTKND